MGYWIRRLAKEEPASESEQDMDDYLTNKTVFIINIAGFIDSNLAHELLRTQSPIYIIGLDNANDYYKVGIKE